MSDKKAFFILVLTVFLLMLSSCSSSHQEQENYLTDQKYFLYNIKWLNEEVLIGQMCQADMKIDGYDIGRVVTWEHNKNKEQLIYEGKEMSGLMPTGIVIGKDNNVYTFDSKACIIFDKSTMELHETIRMPENIYSLDVSPYGEFAARSDNGIIIFSKEDFLDKTLLMEETTTEESEKKQYVFYDYPKWSPDGNWIAYYKSVNNEKLQLGVIARDQTQELAFDFNNFTNYAWSTDSTHLIAINEGTAYGGPLELRIFNIMTGETIVEVFDMPIEGQEIEYFKIL